MGFMRGFYLEILDPESNRVAKQNPTNNEQLVVGFITAVICWALNTVECS